LAVHHLVAQYRRTLRTPYRDCPGMELLAQYKAY
jgi:hypothetical protein